ncbi:MAG: mechanosensitive ion channel domain-containing protein, partial [Planctomycetota bacterium]|nr:mechanosensitive ion channel domain-containing protein [Planctomycetota bacterium]
KSSLHFLLAQAENTNPPSNWDQAIGVAVLLATAIISYFLMRAVILPLISRWVGESKNKIDDMLLDPQLLHRICLLAPFTVIYLLVSGTAYVPEALSGYLPAVFRSNDLGSTWWAPLEKINEALIVLLVTLAVSAAINAFNSVYQTFEISRQRPLKGYLQIVKLLAFAFGAVIIIAILTGQSVGYFVTGLGAMTAVLLLVFKDTILSLVASIQLTQNDMVRVGDWIEIPGAGVDGDVIDVALHTVKVQNWDKTIATVPTAQLIQKSFRNWRGMSESGGRRIKRSLSIDMSTIRFLEEDEIERFSRFSPLKQYMESKLDELDSHNKENDPGPDLTWDPRRLTNIGTLRAYIIQYLRGNKRLHQEGMTLLVRQLQPGSQGLPIEIYCFANDTAWANYEDIQADIFDHLLSKLPEFGLKVFQEPSSSDFKSLAGARE